ncbi:MAG TPA: hypothetical protein PKA13_02515 [Geminicoccaceae bacterium]|nr:hypothetical protein [Geminicoccus sp.]HMU48618.1 hypothetical protein [Geminicoccaceae bacterium]
MSTPAAPPLPARELVARTYQDVIANRDGLVRIGLPWLVGPFVLNVLGTAIEGVVVSLIADLASFVGLSAIAVAWHRHVILGEPLSGPIASVNGRVLRYLLLGVLVSLLAVIPGILIVSAASTVGLVDGEGSLLSVLALAAAFFAAVMVFARLQLVFPGVAIGDPAGLRGSWQMTRGNGGRLLAGLLLTILPVIGAVLLAQLIGAAFNGLGAAKAGAFLALAAASLGSWLQAPLVAAFLSFSYLWFRAAVGEALPATTA